MWVEAGWDGVGLSAACIALTTIAARFLSCSMMTPYENCRSPTMCVLVSFGAFTPSFRARSHTSVPPLNIATTWGAATMRSAISWHHIARVSGVRLTATVAPPPFMLPSSSCIVFISTLSISVALYVACSCVAIILPQVWEQAEVHVALLIRIIRLLKPRVLRKPAPRRDGMSDMQPYQQCNMNPGPARDGGPRSLFFYPTISRLARRIINVWIK